MVLQLKKCCCCGDLRTGSLIIGYLTLIRDLLLTVVPLILVILSGTRALRVLPTDFAIMCIILVIGITSLIFTTILLIGLHEYKNTYLKAYLIYNMVIFVIAVLLIIIFGIVFGLPVVILLFLFFLSIHTYYMLVIGSYYLKMDDPLMQPAIFRTPEGPPLTAAHIP